LTARLSRVPRGQTATKIGPSRLGDMAEYWVCLLAAWKGAEVFKNQNSTGHIDLILVLADGSMYPIDVKLARPNGQGSWSGDTNKVKSPVIPVLVVPKGDDIAGWKVQWIHNRHPEHLANFWDRSLTPFTHQ